VHARGTLLALACLVLVLSACGESKLDTSRLETQIQKSLRERTGLAIASVSCPSDVTAKKGDTFRCVATTTRKDEVAINVVQEDDEGRVTWRVAPRPGLGKPGT
jgi:hypothetical protein